MTLFEIIIIGLIYSFMYGYALESSLAQIMCMEFNRTTHKVLYTIGVVFLSFILALLMPWVIGRQIFWKLR